MHVLIFSDDASCASCLLPVGVCIDAHGRLAACQLVITHLQLKIMSVIYESAHVAITFQ